MRKQKDGRRKAAQALIDKKFSDPINRIYEKFTDPGRLTLLEALQSVTDLNTYRRAFLETELDVGRQLLALNVFLVLQRLLLVTFSKHKPDEAQRQEWSAIKALMLAALASNIAEMFEAFCAIYLENSWVAYNQDEIRVANENVTEGVNDILTRLKVLRWQDPERSPSDPNWEQIDLERFYAMICMISKLTPLLQKEMNRSREIKLRAAHDLVEVWACSLSEGHARFLCAFFPRSFLPSFFTENTFRKLIEGDGVFKIPPAPEKFLDPVLGGLNDRLFQSIEKALEVSFKKASSPYSFLDLLKDIFAKSALAQVWVEAQKQKLVQKADEYARLLAEELACEEQERLERYRLRMQTKRELAQTREEENEDQPQSVKKEDQPPAAERSEILMDLHELMRNVSINMEEKIEKLKRVLRGPSLSAEENLELNLALTELILKQKEVKPCELEEQIKNLGRVEKNDWVLGLLDELHCKLTELNEAKARARDRTQSLPPKEKTFCLVSPEVKAVLASLEDFWGTAYVVGGFPRNHFAKIEANTDIDLVVIGCPHDFFSNAEYRNLLSQQLSKKLAKDVVVETTNLDRLLKISIGAESYDVWFSEEKLLGLELSRRDFYCNTICVNKYGQSICFFPSAILDAEGKKCKPVKGWQEFFKDPIRLLRLIKMTELGTFSLEDEKLGGDKKIVGAEFKRVRSFTEAERQEWLNQNPQGFEIYLKKILRAAFKKYLKGDEKPLRKIIMLLGTGLAIERAPEFLRYDSFVAVIKDVQRCEPKKPSLAAGPHVFQSSPAVVPAAPAVGVSPSC